MTGAAQPEPEPTAAPEPAPAEPLFEAAAQEVGPQEPAHEHAAPVEAPQRRLSTKDKIRQAKAPARTVPICLATDMQEEFERLDAALREAVARESMDKRLNSGGESKRIARDIEALQERMAEYVIHFRLQALGARRWEALQKQHPAEEGNNEHIMLGYNPDTFAEAAIRACTVEPTDLDDEDWTALLGDDKTDGKLTPHQFATLWQTVLDLNIRKIDVPNSFAASRVLRPSEGE